MLFLCYHGNCLTFQRGQGKDLIILLFWVSVTFTTQRDSGTCRNFPLRSGVQLMQTLTCKNIWFLQWLTIGKKAQEMFLPNKEQAMCYLISLSLAYFIGRVICLIITRPAESRALSDNNPQITSVLSFTLWHHSERTDAFLFNQLRTKMTVSHSKHLKTSKKWHPVFTWSHL